jgi:GNAT superfamily N-acetyltransferase
VQRDSELEYTIGPAMQGEMPYRAFCDWQRDVIDRITDRGALVLVARDAAQPVYIYGFLCAERAGDAVVTHYTHVRKDWCLRGIATALLAEAIEQLGEGASELLYTHDSDRSVKYTAEERERYGRPTGVDRGLTAKLGRMGMHRVALEELLQATEAA